MNILPNVYFKGYTYGLGEKIPGSTMRAIMRSPYLNGDHILKERVGQEAGAYHLWSDLGINGESLYCLGSGPYGYQVWKLGPQGSWISDQDSKNQQVSLYVRHLIPLLG